MEKKDQVLSKIRQIADYQFGRNVGKSLFSDEVQITFSKNTGRIRHIYLAGKRIATLRPKDGTFSLTVEGAKRILKGVNSFKNVIRVSDEAVSSVAIGKSVFAKHVLHAHREIRPKEEVIVVDSEGKVLAVGRAILTGEEMKAFKTGVAVKVRKGARED